MLGFGLFGPFLPLYAELLGATIGIQIGVIASAFTITRALSSTPIGWLSDRIGRKTVLSIGLFTYALITFGLAFSGDWIQLIVMRGIQGATSAMIWTPAIALIADSTPPERRGTSLSIFNSSAMTGIILGPGLGGAIQLWTRRYLGFSLVNSFRSPFYFGAMVAILSTVVVWLRVREVGPKTKKTGLKFDGKDRLSPRFRTTFYTLLAFGFSNGFAYGFIQPIIVFFAEHEYSLTVDETGSAMAFAFFLSGLSNASLQLLGGKLADRTRSRKILITTSVLTSQIFTYLLPFSPNILYLVGLFAARSGFMALFRPSLVSLQEDIMPRTIRGKLTGVMDTATSLGAVVGPLLGFWLYDVFSASAPFQLGALFFVASAIFFQVRAKEPRLEEAEL